MSTVKPVFVIAGVGDGSGTGGSVARLFAASGYRVALIGRTADLAKKLVDEINAAGGEAASFGSGDYNFQSTTAVWERVKSHRWASSQEPAPIRVALWNAAGWAFKPFLGHTEADLDAALEGNIKGAFAFSQQAILTFKENEVDEHGARGTLLFTGGTASWRSNPYTSALAIGKLGLRSLSLSLAQEFGKENIHVVHAIIDGRILTDIAVARQPEEQAKKEFVENKDIRLNPDSISSTYLFLVNQDRSAWTWELDLRPAHEAW